MRLTWNELTVPFDSDEACGLLSDWRWLVGEEVEIVLIGSLGDLFLRDESGQILWLDQGSGRLSVIAESEEEFRQLLQQPEQVNEWFLPQIVGDLLLLGRRLAPGECFGYKLPPMVGGQVEPDNFEPTSLHLHCSICGQIARKNSEHQDGARIVGFVEEERD